MSKPDYDLGQPSELFYWGPTRTKPTYMSDWLAATEQVFVAMACDPELPTPPKSLILFCDGQMVMLCNNKDFGDWVTQAFEAYTKRNKLNQDIANWQKLAKTNNPGNLVEAWSYTIFAEFSLYGAERSLARQLSRFDDKTRQQIWGAFTIPDNSTFLARIDAELKSSQNPELMAKKYPWIQDGYDGVKDTARAYFTERLPKLLNNTSDHVDTKPDRASLAQKLALRPNELSALNLTRALASFMDDRKAWMMQTRRLIHASYSGIEHGWYFEKGIVPTIDQPQTQKLWHQYVNFQTAHSVVKGLVASNGGKHLITGEVATITSPEQAVDGDKILVVPSTSPSYVPLMRSARALITDHGGMMSHAAIVAREFGLPCIVGTKQATKVLKTGDHVTLDLVKGEVKIEV